MLARHRFHRGYVEVSGVFFEEKKEGWGGRNTRRDPFKLESYGIEDVVYGE